MTKTLTKKAEKSSGKNGLHATSIDIPSKSRVVLVDMLNQSLAETFDLYSQVKQAHWNVKGPHFYQLHTLFDDTASEILEYVDELAERATTLGGTARGTARMSADASTLPEYPDDIANGMDHVEALIERFALYTRLTRECIDKATEMGDADTADLYTEISRGVDKRLWFLEAHTQAAR
ncbi:MAG: DNA starvation/stationary phase protection protein Dps [Candidatus Obscuribacterales bacterium]|nr:DNA starvation/stationary phase protection protein Dps [Candidatus Obscuribacterales bacterium]